MYVFGVAHHVKKFVTNFALAYTSVVTYGSV